MIPEPRPLARAAASAASFPRLAGIVARCLLPALILLTGCATTADKHELRIDRAWLESSDAAINPAHRTIQQVHKLSQAEVAMLSSLLSDANPSTLGYVACQSYIRCETPRGMRRFGLILRSDGSLDALDFTPPDPLLAWVTSPHDILVPRDAALAERFVKSVLGP